MKKQSGLYHRTTRLVGGAVLTMGTLVGDPGPSFTRSARLVALAEAQAVPRSGSRAQAPPLLSQSEVEASLNTRLHRMRDRRMTQQLHRAEELQRLHESGRAPAVDRVPPPRVPPPPVRPDTFE